MKNLKHENLLFPDKRPPCPRCGGTHIISRGTEWQCFDCNRRWVKKPRLDFRHIRKFQCPNCLSHSLKVRCLECGLVMELDSNE